MTSRFVHAAQRLCADHCSSVSEASTPLEPLAVTSPRLDNRSERRIDAQLDTRIVVVVAKRSTAHLDSLAVRGLSGPGDGRSRGLAPGGRDTPSAVGQRCHRVRVWRRLPLGLAASGTTRAVLRVRARRTGWSHARRDRRRVAPAAGAGLATRGDRVSRRGERVSRRGDRVTRDEWTFALTRRRGTARRGAPAGSRGCRAR